MFIPFYAIAVLAGFRALCPPSQGALEYDPCPDPLARVVYGFIAGAIAAVGYFFLFVGKRALECCDLIAVAILAYLFSYFIWALFFAKKSKMIKARR
jgi:hypothetical protein